MDQEFMNADKQFRNRVLVIVICIIIILSIIILFGLPAFNNLLHKMEPVMAMKIQGTVMFFLFLIPLPLGFKLLSISNHILREERYPPEGMKVLRDTLIIRGNKAKLHAYLLLLFAFLLFFICIFCAFSAHIFLRILMTTRSFL
jgi:hypothetical protein